MLMAVRTVIKRRASMAVRIAVIRGAIRCHGLDLDEASGRTVSIAQIREGTSSSRGCRDGDYSQTRWRARPRARVDACSPTAKNPLTMIIYQHRDDFQEQHGILPLRWPAGICRGRCATGSRS